MALREISEEYVRQAFRAGGSMARSHRDPLLTVFWGDLRGRRIKIVYRDIGDVRKIITVAWPEEGK